MSKNSFIFLLFSLFLIINTENQNETKNSDKKEAESEEKPYAYYDDEEDLKKLIKSYNYTNINYYDDTNYTLILNRTEPVFILFYTPTCHYCIQFIPLYIETADYCKQNNIESIFVRIDSSVSPNATEEFDVEEYPSIFFVFKEEKYKYDGIASKEAMLSFMEKKKNDDVFVIKSLKEIKDYLAKKNLVLMSTLTDKKSDLYDSFLNFARSTINLEFVSCETKECINKYGEDVILFKTFDEKENSYKKEYAIINPEINFNSVYDFVSIFSIEMGGFLAPHGIDALVNYAKQALIYVRNNTGENITTDKYDPLFKQLGKELRFNNTYVYVSDMGQTTGTNIGDAFSILPEELPCIFFYQQNTGDPYTNVKTFSKRNLDMTKENGETIKNFIDDVLKGKILRDLYSEPPSDSGMENGILKVVGKTFDRDVVREKRNVFLAVIEDEDYMEEEQKFLRMLREMAKKNENKNLIFAYINVGRNEPRDLEIWGIPFPFGFLYTNALEKKSIIKFIPKDHKDISEKEVMNFIEKNINVEDRNEDL
jgi:thiol-disulfide isomerase/thioredoxin